MSLDLDSDDNNDDNNNDNNNNNDNDNNNNLSYISAIYYLLPLLSYIIIIYRLSTGDKSAVNPIKF